MMFLSQSVLCGDGSMSTRIAHEISHVWFGLLVGAKDWTEEWLSEGFATYIEDRIVYLANKVHKFVYFYIRFESPPLPCSVFIDSQTG